MSLALLGLSDGRMASSFDDNTIKITNDFNFSKYSILIGHNDKINSLREFNDNILASASCDKTIRLWNLSDSTLIKTLSGHNACVTGLINAKVYDKNLLISSSSDNTFKIWNETTPISTITNWELPITINNKTIANLNGHTGSVTAFAIIPSSQSLVSASADKTIKVWNSTTFKLIATLTNHTREISALALIPSSEFIVSASFDKTINL